MDRNLPIAAHEHDLLTPLSKAFLFFKRSAAVIDGSEKRNGWLNFELQSPHVIERSSKCQITVRDNIYYSRDGCVLGKAVTH